MSQFSISEIQKFSSQFYLNHKLKFSLDINSMEIPPEFWQVEQPKFDKAFGDLQALESGKKVNVDEGRMVGHYWLRNSDLAPNAEIRTQINNSLTEIENFGKAIHSQQILSSSGEAFKHILLIGIGGSALGPQFVNNALRSVKDPMNIYFMDNTDPDGMARVLSDIPALSRTLVLVISKSGGTKETRNGQLVTKAAFEAKKLKFEKHFVAVTGEGSLLDKTAIAEGWLKRFAMWDWVGGRTSELSAVGLLPAMLQGFSIREILAGAKAMDQETRIPSLWKNPAAILAGAWYHVGGGKGSRDMVVLPYKDRLELFSRYLQQLVMESIGKEKDLSGKKVEQGLAVYGNKGSTDQHAYVQELRDGLKNFFVTFIEVLKNSSIYSTLQEISEIEVEPGITSGDYLAGFLTGTRLALAENKRESLTVCIDEINEFSIGMLIALFERAVSIYASMVNVNAYHQPGVEAGKKAAADVILLQQKVSAFLQKSKGKPQNIEQITMALGPDATITTVFSILRRLVANGKIKTAEGGSIFSDTYAI